MRRRSLRQLKIDELLEIYFDCSSNKDLLEKYGYHFQHFYARMRELGIDAGHSSNFLNQYSKKEQREIIFSVVVECDGSRKKTATILGLTPKALEHRIYNMKLHEAIRRAVELENEARNS